MKNNNKNIEIENSLTSITNIMFNKRELWDSVTDEMKKTNFFIINRFLSKKYPEQSFLLNDKNIDEVLGMEIWFAFMYNKPYPKWMWSKSTTQKEKNFCFSENDLLLLQSHLNITLSELQILIQYHLNDVKEELEYFKKTEK